MKQKVIQICKLIFHHENRTGIQSPMISCFINGQTIINQLIKINSRGSIILFGHSKFTI